MSASVESGLTCRKACDSIWATLNNLKVDCAEAPHHAPDLHVGQGPVQFLSPPAADMISADADEFARLFGLRPDLAEVLGLRQYLREDTAKNLN